jgi:hypothetical protein
MNELQTVLHEIIYRVSNVPGIFDHADSVVYGLRDYIARYSLANDRYYISEDAFAIYEDHDLPAPLLRGKLQKLKAHFTYDHPVPLSLTLRLIKNSNRTRDDIQRYLSVSDCVALITKEEDKRINALHKCEMPDGWICGLDSQFARYELHGVRLCKEKIPVTGALFIK